MWCSVALAVAAPAAPAGEQGSNSDGSPAREFLSAPEARSDFGMVATGSPEATEAAVGILEKGGNAVDAAVAAAMTLGVSDPDASGLGGITYMLIHLAGGPTVAIDGTAVAPLAVDNVRLQQMKTGGAFYGYELATVPTTLAVLDHALRSFGTMDMAEVLEPAITVAERGYRLSALQIEWTVKYMPSILASEYLRLIAMEDGRNLGQPGDVLCRPALAATLRRIARDGAASFYRGAIADEIEADMVLHGGFLRKTDLARHRVRVRAPLTMHYRDVRVDTFPPPGGGAAVTGMLNILEQFPSALLATDTVARHQVFLEASRIALVDSRRPPLTPAQAVWDVPVYLSKEHSAERARLITPGRKIPAGILGPPPDPECEPTQGESTTHVSVVDRQGNVVSLTQTLGRSFGAAVATPGLGFPYNSLLEAFNFDKPQCPSYLQPRSLCVNDMSPTVVMDGANLLVALGSPGSNRIPAIVATVISNMVDRDQGLRDAVVAPRVLWGGITSLRAFVEIAPPITEADVKALDELGYQGMTSLSFPPVVSDFVKFGGVNAVGWDANQMTFVGVGDPRRHGSARGPEVVAARAGQP
jgi:gamma-glutamyltranspeptidase/glutathione hydrolase